MDVPEGPSAGTQESAQDEETELAEELVELANGEPPRNEIQAAEIALWNQVKLRLLLAGVDAAEVRELDAQREALHRRQRGDEVDPVDPNAPADPDAPVDPNAPESRMPTEAVGLMRSRLLWEDEPRITIHELAEQSGLDVETTRRARMLLGLPDPGDAAVCRFEEIETFKGFASAMELYGTQTILQYSRVIGSALATVAEGALSVFARTLTGISESDEDLPEGDEFTLMTFDAFESFRTVPEVLQVAGKLLFEQAVDQLGAEPGVPQLAAVGFVDLIGSTITTETLGVEAMASALTRFEEWSAELAVLHGGRVVKYIGDEVMFVAPDLPNAVTIASELTRRISEDPVLRSCRAGIAYGEVLNRDGDWFGTTVNIASRLVDKAKRGTVMVTGDGAESCEHAVGKGRKRLRGISDRIDVWRIDVRD